MNTILVIDDDDQLRCSFEKLLTVEGYQVVSAASAEAGLQSMAVRCPDLVILDIRLPGMNGLEAFERLHASEPNQGRPLLPPQSGHHLAAALESAHRGH